LSKQAKDHGLSTYTLSNLMGFGIHKSSTFPNDLYYFQVTSPGTTPTVKMGKFTYDGIRNSEGFSTRLSHTTDPSINQDTILTTKRQSGSFPNTEMLLPSTGYNLSANTYDHKPVTCNPHFQTWNVPMISWDDCIRRRLGGQAL